jgi:hypothetical protein
MESPVAGSSSCGLVRNLIADWARDKSRPFPYLAAGEHLAKCRSCLSWATGIAYQPTEHYVRALRLRLSWVIGILGQSVLRAWSNDDGLRFDTVYAQDPEAVRERIGKRLVQCENYSPELKEQVEKIRELMPDPVTGEPPEGLEPYTLARYFLETAVRLAPESGQRSKLLNQLGLAEYVRAVGEQRAGRREQADRHFGRAREYHREVMAAGVRSRPDPEDAGTGEKVDQVSARLSLAQVEYVQGEQSRPALEAAIGLCLDAKRLVGELGLAEEKFTRIQSNLMICYLRLFLEHAVVEALGQARQLAEEVCARPAVAPIFLKRWLVDKEDPELTQLLESPRVKNLSDYLKGEARRAPGAEAVALR